MRAIDSLLNILVQQGGTELRLVSDRRPQMFKGDAELPLTIPAMPADRIRDLLDDFWTAHEAALRERVRGGQLGSSRAEGDLDLCRIRLREAHREDSQLGTAIGN